jgi:predicted transcriptional regulator YdeE
VIGKQWQRFMSEGLLDKIPNKLAPDIYAVYTDYASDANGDYTFLLGAKVKNSAADLPAGMVKKTVPAGRYGVFTSARGPVAKVVVEAWQEIWSYFQSGENGTRAYHADFELHDQRSADPDNAQVDIYIGLK